MKELTTRDNLKLKVHYMRRFGIPNTSYEDLSAIKDRYQDNAWGRRMVGIEQHPHYGVIIDLLETAMLIKDPMYRLLKTLAERKSRADPDNRERIHQEMAQIVRRRQARSPELTGKLQKILDEE